MPKIETGFRVGMLTVTGPTEQRKNGYTVWRCRCDCGGERLLDTRALQRGALRDCGCKTTLPPGAKDLTGRRFGRLVVLSPTDRRQYGSLVWRCQCDCGNQTEVSVHQLTGGYTKSCGCWGRPALKDYVGRRFGQLTVTAYEGKRDGMHRWRCLCDCGRETVVGQTLLQSGKTKSCGCLAHPPAKAYLGKRFGQLTVIADGGKVQGQYLWRCRCDCGRETVVQQWYLQSGHTKSCGCLQKKIVVENLHLVDGTSVTKLEAGKKRRLSSNTSGHTGVYQNRKTGKWVAQITFKRKTYYLGAYDKLEDAVKARQRGEEMHDDFLEWYYNGMGSDTDETGKVQKGPVADFGGGDAFIWRCAAPGPGADPDPDSGGTGAGPSAGV